MNGARYCEKPFSEWLALKFASQGLAEKFKDVCEEGRRM